MSTVLEKTQYFNRGNEAPVGYLDTREGVRSDVRDTAPGIPSCLVLAIRKALSGSPTTTKNSASRYKPDYSETSIIGVTEVEIERLMLQFQMPSARAPVTHGHAHAVWLKHSIGLPKFSE